jgi:putative ABC transport system permease protein
MKFLGLVLANFKRHRLRTTLTILSIAVAFVLFGYLGAIRTAFAMGIDLAGADRLVVRHKVSIIQLLPESYGPRMEQLDGVEEAMHATWFGGIYQEPKNFFAQMALRPEKWRAMYPEFLLPPDQMEAWTKTRTGAVVGRATAERFGWKIGDRIPIQATIWRPKSGGLTWEFDLVGIYDGAEKGTDVSQFFFRHDYFDEMRMGAQGLVGWYTIRVSDPARAEAIAEQIDEMFANSPAETQTETEGAFVQAFANQAGNIGAIVTAILTAVFFTILLVAGNTMAQAVRERTRELGVMKAIGFSQLQVVSMVLLESIVIAVVGGALGLSLAWMMISRGDPTGGAFPMFYLPESALLVGAFLTLLLGLVTGFLPALQAMRLNTVEALRRE